MRKNLITNYIDRQPHQKQPMYFTAEAQSSPTHEIWCQKMFSRLTLRISGSKRLKEGIYGQVTS
jgi:hypothetical protein